MPEIDSKTTQQLLDESKPLTPAQRATWSRMKKRLARRAKLGKHGTKVVSVTIEEDLLQQANAYAKAQGLKRSQLFSQGLQLRLGLGKSPAA